MKNAAHAFLRLDSTLTSLALNDKKNALDSNIKNGIEYAFYRDFTIISNIVIIYFLQKQ